MPFKDKIKKQEYNKNYWKENMNVLKEKNKIWRKNNPNIITKLNRKYLEENRERINERIRKKYHNNEEVKIKRLVRRQTQIKYGPLKEGYVFHHTTEPYHKDTFIILEKDFHDYYHKNLPQFLVRAN
jgi:hypothetical protein